MIQLITILSLLPNDTNYTTPWFYEIVTDYQDQFITWLKKNNIGCRVMYPELNKQKAFCSHKQFNSHFKISNQISSKGVWIPSHPKLKISDIDFIISTINKFKPY